MMVGARRGSAGLAAAAFGLLALSGCAGRVPYRTDGRPGAPPSAGASVVSIGPADTVAGLMAKAAGVRPSERQLRWQGGQSGVLKC